MSESPPRSETLMKSTPAIDRLRSLLRQTLRVTISDGRVFLGSFAGTDQPLNILLVNTEEYRPKREENTDGRYVGQVVIPWRLITKIEAEALPETNVGSGQIYI